MNDRKVIYLDDAIDAIYKCTDYYIGNLPIMIDKADAYKALDGLPSAQPESQWIPCSERLPEKSGQYYVSGGDRVWICEFLIIPNFTGGWCNDVTNPVVQAWMPLPEPWKGEQP